MKQDLEIIAEEVCNYYNIDIETLDNNSRKKEIVLPRQICHYIARKLTKNSLSVIGINIGLKNHATVLYSCNTIDNLMFWDKNLQKELSDLKPIIDEKLSKLYFIPDKINMSKVRDFIYAFTKETAEIVLNQLNNISIILHISRNYIKLYNHSITTITV